MWVCVCVCVCFCVVCVSCLSLCRNNYMALLRSAVNYINKCTNVNGGYTPAQRQIIEFSIKRKVHMWIEQYVNFHSFQPPHMARSCNKKTVFPSGSVHYSSAQFICSVVSDSLRPHESQHPRPPCPSPTPGVHADSRSSSQWCHPANLSSVVPFFSCPQSLPASKSFPMNQLFT